MHAAMSKVHSSLEIAPASTRRCSSTSGWPRIVASLDHARRSPVSLGVAQGNLCHHAHREGSHGADFISRRGERWTRYFLKTKNKLWGLLWAHLCKFIFSFCMQAFNVAHASRAGFITGCLGSPVVSTPLPFHRNFPSFQQVFHVSFRGRLKHAPSP